MPRVALVSACETGAGAPEGAEGAEVIVCLWCSRAGTRAQGFRRDHCGRCYLKALEVGTLPRKARKGTELMAHAQTVALRLASASPEARELVRDVLAMPHGTRPVEARVRALLRDAVAVP